MKKYIILLFLLLVAAINFNMVLSPLHLITGGTQGLAILGNHLFSIKPSLIIFIINSIMLLISLILLRKETTIGTIIATLAYPLFVKLTDFMPSLNIATIILVFISGTISGLTGGFIYKLGFSSGGINVLSVVLKKYFLVKISITTFIINALILVTGVFYFGFVKLFYSLIVISINSTLIYFIMKKK